MSALKLVSSSIRHAWLRNTLLMLSVAVAYTLFGTLTAFERAYSSSGDIGANRMITVNKISFTQPLPMSHYRAVQQLDGVAAASFATWFGGYYREPRNSLHTIAVDPRSHLAVYGDDIKLSPRERSTFLQERASVLVGESMARRFGWKVGDQIPILNRRISRADGSRTWTFRIAGIFEGATAFIDTSFLYIHYNLLNEARARDRDTIGWIAIAPGRDQDPGALGQTIDSMFENSADRTTTDSERSFSQKFVAQFGDLALVTVLILGAAFFSLLVIVASTTTLAIRQRAHEIGILKALGFPHPHLLTLLIGESLTVILAGGVLGLVAATVLVRSAAASLTLVAPGMAVSPQMIGAGLLSMLALAVAASALPAWRSVNAATAAVLRRG